MYKRQVFGKYGKKLLGGVFTLKGFSYYDMAMTIMPAFAITVFGVLFNVSMGIYGLMTGNLFIASRSVIELLKNSYILMFAIGAITTISEWKNIHTSTAKKIFFTFTFPIFMFTYIPISCQALFTKVQWKPIEHKVAVSLSQIK